MSLEDPLAYTVPCCLVGTEMLITVFNWAELGSVVQGFCGYCSGCTESFYIHLLVLSSQGHSEVSECIRFVNTELGTERFSS